MDRLQDELTEGGRDYIGAVIKESMRLRPVIIDTGRTLLEPTQLRGNYAAGMVVTPSILLAHHRPDIYPNPMKFCPERFLRKEAPEPITWIPLGGGIRGCLGPGFATLEMEVVIRTSCSSASFRRRVRMRTCNGAEP